MTNSPHDIASSRSGNSRPILEDYQLPAKYRRRLLDESEINAINVNSRIVIYSLFHNAINNLLLLSRTEKKIL